ncbi:MAG: hypothetical protein WBN40_11850 [Pseudomonadales bacterium]
MIQASFKHIPFLLAFTRRRGALSLLQKSLFISASLFAGYVSAAFVSTQDIASQRVAFPMTGGTQSEYQWYSNFDIGYTAATQSFNIELDIGLIGHNASQSLIDTWEAGIEELWSGRYYVMQDGTSMYNVVVDANLFDYETAPILDRFNANHTVFVHEGAGGFDLGNWYIDEQNVASHYELAAHEIGHLFGNYDEYQSGAVDPNDPTYWNDYDTLMGWNVTHNLEERHYQFVLDWVEGQAGGGSSFSLVAASGNNPPAPPVPLPAAAYLFASAIFGTLLARRCAQASWHKRDIASAT